MRTWSSGRYPADLVPHDFAIKHWVLNNTGARKIHICAISAPNGEVVGIGHAICSPEDTYDRERGREIAQGRAIKQWSGHDGMKTVTVEERLNANIEAVCEQLEEIYVHSPFDDAFNRFG